MEDNVLKNGGYSFQKIPKVFFFQRRKTNIVKTNYIFNFINSITLGKKLFFLITANTAVVTYVLLKI